MPEEKPKTRAKVRDRAVSTIPAPPLGLLPLEGEGEEVVEEEEELKSAAGNQKARVANKQRRIVRIKVLNLPMRSANIPGNHLPKREPAPRMVSRR